MATNENISELKKLVVDKFSNQLDQYCENLYRMTMKEMKNEILKIQQSFLKNQTKNTDFYTLLLTQSIYKKRFKREVILNGLKASNTEKIE